ncbi:hypothetical protein HK097_011505, partial [Rhizophlyctis rosea]
MTKNFKTIHLLPTLIRLIALKTDGPTTQRIRQTCKTLHTETKPADILFAHLFSILTLPDGFTKAWSWASQKGYIKIINHLLPHASQDNLNILLKNAVRFGHKDLVQLAIEKGANIHHESNRPLILAAQNANFEIIKILLAAGANPRGDPEYECDVLHHVPCRDSNADLVKFLIDEYGFTQDVHDMGPENLFLNALECKQLGYAKMILTAGIDDWADGYPLWMSACKGNVEAVKMVLESEVGERMMPFLNDALQRAACWGHVEVAKYLVERGGDVNHIHRTWGHDDFVEQGHLEMVKFLYASGKDMKADDFDSGALKTASLYRNLDMVRLLLDNGVRPDRGFVDEIKKLGKEDVLKVFVEKGVVNEDEIGPIQPPSTTTTKPT